MSAADLAILGSPSTVTLGNCLATSAITLESSLATYTSLVACAGQDSWSTKICVKGLVRFLHAKGRDLSLYEK